MKKNDKTFRHRHFQPRQPPTTLVFSPLAWLKLMFFLHAGETEVGFFCISRGPQADDLLYIQDILTIPQTATAAHFEFDKVAVIEFFEQMAQQGRKPEEFWAILGHTHPGSSPEPSWTDEESIGGYFDRHPWSIMFIISREQRTYARLSFATGPGAQVLLDVAVDWAAWPKLAVEEEDFGNRVAGWKAEYEQNIMAPKSKAVLHMFFEEPQRSWEYEEYDFFGQEWPPPGLVPSPAALLPPEGEVAS